MIDDESCNWALWESLAGEVSQRNTITVEEFQYAGPDTRGVHNRAEPFCRDKAKRHKQDFDKAEQRSSGFRWCGLLCHKWMMFSLKQRCGCDPVLNMKL